MIHFRFGVIHLRLAGRQPGTVGDDPWKRVRPLHELVEQMEPQPPGTNVGAVILVDVQREEVATMTTTLEGLVKLHLIESFEEVGETVQDLRPLVADDEKLAQAFLGFVNDEILRKMAKKGEKTIRLRSLEDTTMLAQRIERIRDGYIEQGERKGLLEGKREEAERLFLKLYKVKNGGSIPDGVLQVAGEAKLKQLETWAERLLTVEHAEDVFEG